MLGTTRAVKIANRRVSTVRLAKQAAKMIAEIAIRAEIW
jgi:hypothetical protein